MKTKKVVKGTRWLIPIMLLVLFAICFGNCKDDKDANSGKEFDPGRPVLISGFTPEKGGRGQRLVIKGENFGNDPAMVKVLIGGKEAKVIGVDGENLFCLVPGKAYEGTLEVHVRNREQSAKVTADKKFEYERKMLVSTLFGYKNDRDDQNWRQGKFYNEDGTPNAAGFKSESYMRFDPIDKHILWVGFDGNALYTVNMKDSTFNKHLDGWDRLRSVEFSPDGKYMVVSEDRGDANGRATRILSRTDGFKGRAVLTKYKLCNTASFHPVNGELYYNSAEQGQFFRFDMEEYYSNPSGYVARKGDELFKVQDSGWAFRIVMHPTGDYAYIMVTNKGCIMRADYNWGLKRFKQPYVVCGEAGQRSWADGIGVNARLNRPYQGVFVKNPEYEAAGKNDIYDYYFTDVDTHSVRILTPEGVVTTFAGRGSPGLNLNADGFVEGEVRLEARFNAPTGIEYDENEKAFYISDTKNRRMRKIALEDMEE